MLDNIFLQISALLALTVTIAFFVRLLRQPLLIAYIIAGIIAGPLFLNMLNGDAPLFDAFAEFGVVLLLFVVGLSLNFDHLKKIGKVAMITGLGQVAFTGLFGFLLLRVLGFSSTPAIFLAIALTFSSTIIMVKLLSDKKDSETVYGRHVIGLMIVQDVIALFVMIFITMFSGGDVGVIGTFIALIGKILLLAALVYVLARFVLPKILRRVASSAEFLFIFTIAWCFGLASALYWAGFPIEIGAIVSGLTLGSSPYQFEIASRIKPLRDFFIIIFFIILGSEMGVHHGDAILAPAAILSAFILVGNPFILYILFRFHKFTRRNSFLAGTTAAQVSEFGFVLLFTGAQAGLLDGSEIPVFTLVALFTIFMSSYVITYNEQIYRFLLPVFRLFGPDKHQQTEEAGTVYDVWVFGYHRIGWKICQTLAAKRISFAVVDFNPQIIARLEHRGIPAYFGDASDVEFLESLPLERADVIISTLPAADDQITLLQHIKRKKPKNGPLFLGNLNHNEHLKDMYAAGADYVMMPHLLGGRWVSDVITDRPWTKHTFKVLKKEQHEEMKLRVNANAHGR